MGATAKLGGVLLIAILGGCAQNAGLGDLSLLQSGTFGTSETASLDGGGEPGDESGPPLPVRNVRRAGEANGEKAEKSQQAGLTLPNLSDVKIFTAAPSNAPDTTQWEAKPVAVYTQLAQRIHACWLTPGAPKLKDHSFHAEVGTTNADSAKIIIYKKAEDGRRGLQAYRITIDGKLTGSTVKAVNRSVERKLDQAFRSDLVRWSNGAQDCKS